MNAVKPLVVAVSLALTGGHALEAAEQVPPTPHVVEAEGWTKTVLAEGLVHPWAMAFLPDGTLLVTERPGNLRRVDLDGKISQPLSGLPGDILAENQGGLLDLVLHPDFADNNLIYFTYSAGSSQANRTTLARARLEDSSVSNVEVLFQATPDKPRGQHFGSRLLWLPDRTLLMTIGDGGNPPLQIADIPAREHAQRLDSHWGKIIRLNDDGSVPDDNPLLRRDDALPEIFSFGHRNPQGIAFDPETGRIWITDHGPLGGDELNLVRAGQNYGWPEQTHGLDYRDASRFAPPLDSRFVPPVVTWTPALAPSGLIFYTGEAFADWQGRLLAGGLLAEQIRVIALDGERVVGEERITIGRRVRDVRQGPDGLIYILTDHADGQLLRLEPR